MAMTELPRTTKRWEWYHYRHRQRLLNRMFKTLDTDINPNPMTPTFTADDGSKWEFSGTPRLEPANMSEEYGMTILRLTMRPLRVLAPDFVPVKNTGGWPNQTSSPPPLKSNVIHRGEAFTVELGEPVLESAAPVLPKPQTLEEWWREYDSVDPSIRFDVSQCHYAIERCIKVHGGKMWKKATPGAKVISDIHDGWDFSFCGPVAPQNPFLAVFPDGTDAKLVRDCILLISPYLDVLTSYDA